MPQELTVDKFIKNEVVENCIKELKEKFPAGNPLIVSDVIDDKGHQYVNLVQKGGGVLGVALVGYTYILEPNGYSFHQAGRHQRRRY